MYCTLAYIKVGRKERPPIKNNTHKAMNIQCPCTYMYTCTCTLVTIQVAAFEPISIHCMYMYEEYFHFCFLRVSVDGGEELAVLQREIEEEVEEEREQYVSELPEREALYHTQLAEWKALRKMRVRMREGGGEGGRGGGGEGGRGGGGEGGREGGRGGGREGGGRGGGREGGGGISYMWLSERLLCE